MNAKIIEMPENKEENTENKVPTQEQAKNILSSLMEDLNVDEALLNPDNADALGLNTLFSVIDLPDDEFITMSGIVLDTLEKSLNNPNDRILLAQSLAISGVSADELSNVYQSAIEEIDEALKDKYDQNRIDYIKAILSLLMNCIQDSQGAFKRSVKIGIQLINENAKLPEYARVGDAGMDVYALEDYEIKPGETKIIPTGFKVAIPKGYELQVRPKSGRAAKTKLRVANTPGTIDSGYRDEVGVIIENVDAPIKELTYEFNEEGKPIITSILHGETYTIGKGEKFAQLVLNEVPVVAWDQVEDIAIYGDGRGGGFGSTGLK